jgi:hypothetical protein
LSRFTADERVFLSYLRQQFFKPETKEQLDEEVKKLQFPKWKRVLSSCWQWIRLPLNFIATISANLIGHTVSKSMGQDFPEIHMNEIKRIFPDLPFKANSSYYDIKCNLNFIQKITSVVTKLGKTRTVVILDRLDEDSRLGGDAEKVARFVEAVVTDHNLLLGGMSLQVIVCLWSVPFYLLEHRGIRPQKINTEKLLWDRDDLENALDTRLRYYSRNNIASWRAVFESGVPEGTFDDIFFVANGNPRNLWQIFDKIFREQHKRASQRTKLTESSARGGLEEFVKDLSIF